MVINTYAILRKDRVSPWPASERDIKAMLGLKKKLPIDPVPAQVIQGVTVWVKPAAEPVRNHFGKLVHQSGHRVMCRCPGCGWEGSVGRLAQHVCKDK